MPGSERRLDIASLSDADAGVSRSVRLHEQDLCYLEFGSASAKRTFVFLAPERGLRDAGPFLRAIAQSGHVIAPVYPSFQSDDPVLLRSVSDYAYLLLDLFDELDIKDVVVMGSSIGGWIAMEMLVRNSARFSQLVLMGSSGVRFGGRTVREIADIFTLTPAETEQLVFHDPHSWAADFSRLDDADVLATARARQAVARFAWLPYMHNPELRRWLHRVRVSTLVLWGRNDRMIDVSYGEQLAQAIPGAQFQSIDACGHFPHVEQAAATAKTVIQFSANRSDKASAIA
jgi:pimeloyl-ACP methyl ester carboxylesterase